MKSLETKSQINLLLNLENQLEQLSYIIYNKKYKFFNLKLNGQGLTIFKFLLNSKIPINILVKNIENYYLNKYNKKIKIKLTEKGLGFDFNVKICYL